MNHYLISAASWARRAVLITHCAVILLIATASWCSGQVVLSRAGLEGPLGGNGDSWAPVATTDGRYVAFASTANNLVASNGVSTSPKLSLPLNVFLRDRIAGTTRLVSVNMTGTGGGDSDLYWTNQSYLVYPSATAHSVPAGISADGRYVLFTSTAGNLVSNDTARVSDIFVRDMKSNATILVSVDAGGSPAGGPSRSPSMSADGRYVAFVSTAFKMVSGGLVTNPVAVVYLRDLQASNTVIVSVGAGQTSPNGDSDYPCVSPDGRYVAFHSGATNLVDGPSGAGDIFVWDLKSQETTWVSAGGRATLTLNGQPNAICTAPLISDDGRFVVYTAGTNSRNPGFVFRYDVTTGATDVIDTNSLVMVNPFDDDFGHSVDLSRDGNRVAFITLATTNSTCVKVWDAGTGTTTLASGNLAGGITDATAVARPLFDAAGQSLAFLGNASDLVANPVTAGPHLYVRNLANGSTVVADTRPNAAGSSLGWGASFCFGGSSIVYDAAGQMAGPGTANRYSDVFSTDLVGGIEELVSVHDPQLTPAVTPNGLCSFVDRATSADNRYIAFVSDAGNLTANDQNGLRDVFVRDLIGGSNILVSVNTNGQSASAPSFEPCLSGDGRYVAFTSAAADIAGIGYYQQVYVRDLKLGMTTRASVGNGVGSNPKGDSHAPQISDDGRWVLFRSTDFTLLNLTGENLYLRDLQTSNTIALPSSGAGGAQMTPDGRYVAFIGTPQSVVEVWDTAAQSIIYTGTDSVGSFAISPDGKYLATDAQGLALITLGTGTKQVLSVKTNPARNLSFSTDGSAVIALEGYLTSTRVYYYSLDGGTNIIVSHPPYDGFRSSDGGRKVDQPVISANGRLVAYRSTYIGTASALSESNTLALIVLYNTTTETETVLNVDKTGFETEYPRNLAFNRDGTRLMFQSAAPELAPGDYNLDEDIFAITVYTNSPPLIIDQPGDLAVARGLSATLRVSAVSDLAPHYQWFFNNQPISGATQDALALAHVLDTNAGAYYVQVGNYSGFVTSRIATITVGDPPSITRQPSDRHVQPGETATFSVSAAGSAPLLVQWWRRGTNDAPVSDWKPASDADLTITAVQPGQTGAYFALASNAFGRVASDTAWLRFTGPPPTFTKPRLSGQNLQLPISGQPGVVYLLLESTDLINWTTNQEINLQSPAQTLTLPSGLDKKFYQLREE